MLQLATYNKFSLPLLRNSQDWPLDEKDKCRVLSSFFRHKFKTTQEMKEIPLTQGYVALVDDSDYEWLSKKKWHVWIKKYGTYAVTHKTKNTFILMHRLILNVPDGMYVDHVDHNGLNNQRSNIRICTVSQNNAHKPRIRAKTGYMGVEYNVTKYGKYIRARIKINKKNVHLGYFLTLEDAARAYDRAAKKQHGEFAFLNFKDDVL